MKLLEMYKRKMKFERSVGRGGPSIAMNMWTFLMDHGPSTVADIDAGLGSRYSNKPTIKSYLDAGLITKQGDTYVANPDYNWDDVGKIERPSLKAASIKAAIDNGSIVNTDDEPSDDDVDINTTSRATSRARSARTTKANIFSRKFDEVKAAVDGGVDVNSKNATDKTALQFAVMSDKPDAGKIVKYLIDHGAELSDYDSGKPLIFEAIYRQQPDVVEALLNAGVKYEDVQYKGKSVYSYIVQVGYKGSLIPFATIKDGSAKANVSRDMTTLIEGLATNSLSENNVNEYIEKMLDFITRQPLLDWYAYLYHPLRSECLRIGRTIDESVIVNRLKKIKVWTEALATQPLIASDIDVLKLIETAYNEKWTLADVTDAEFAMQAMSIVRRSRRLDVSAISYMLSPDVIKQLVTDNPNVYRELIGVATEKRSVELMSNVAKARVSLPKSIILKIVSTLVSKYAPVTREFTRTCCKVLGQQLRRAGGKDVFDYDTLVSIATCENEYFVEFMVENGFGEILASKKLSPTRSEIVDKVLKNHGYAVSNAAFVLHSNSYGANVEEIVSGIRHDETSRLFRSIITDHPEILDDPEVVRVANYPKYKDNFTAKLVQQAIADRKEAIKNDPNKSKYDF